MNFHRIDYIDTHGYLSNLWRADANSANTVAARLSALGMKDVHVESVAIPIGDPLKFKHWLNNNPNSPNLKDSTMESKTMQHGAGIIPDGEPCFIHMHKDDPRMAKMSEPLVWPPLPIPTVNTVPPAADSALKVQVAGDHYKKMTIQPIEFIHANGIPFAEGCVIKYMTRWRDKGGIKDLEKARHFIDLLIELEQRATEE